MPCKAVYFPVKQNLFSCRRVYTPVLIKRCPKIHRNGADKNFYIYNFHFCRQENPNRHNQGKAAVTIGFWIFDIVGGAYRFYIVLRAQQISNQVNIVNIRTGHPAAGNIGQVLPCRLHGKPVSSFLQFPDNTCRGFNPCFDKMDRISFMCIFKTIVQVLHFGYNLPGC